MSPLPLLLGAIVVYAARKSIMKREAAGPAYSWAAVPATAAGSEAVSAMQLGQVLAGPAPKWVTFAAMSTPAQYDSGGHVLLLQIRGEILGTGTDARGKRYFDVRISDRFPIGLNVNIKAPPAVGTIARIGDDAIMAAENGGQGTFDGVRGGAVVQPCIVTYSGGSTAPCVDPLLIDRAIQGGPGSFSVQFMMGRDISPTSSERYLMVGRFVRADVVGGSRRTFVEITSSSAPDANAFFPHKGDTVVISDAAYVRITEVLPGASVGGAGLLFAAVGALALVVMSKGKSPSANSPNRSAQCQQMWTEAGGNVSITKMPPDVAKNLRAALAFGGMGAAADAKSGSDATQQAFRNGVAAKFDECGMTVLAGEIRSGKDINGVSLFDTSGAAVGAGGGRGGGGGHVDPSAAGFNPGYGYFHAQPQQQAYAPIYPFRSPAAIVSPGAVVDQCAFSAPIGRYAQTALLCAMQVRGLPALPALLPSMVVTLNARLSSLAAAGDTAIGDRTRISISRGNAALAVVDRYMETSGRTEVA